MAFMDRSKISSTGRSRFDGSLMFAYMLKSIFFSNTQKDSQASVDAEGENV
jgi:hypothetical protein